MFKKPFFILSLIGILVISGCSSAHTNSSSSSSSWAYEFVKIHGTTYVVTNGKIKVDKVGNSIGEILSYSDKEIKSPGDNFSNVYKKGTKLYAIKGLNQNNAIAVKTGKNQFIKAKKK